MKNINKDKTKLGDWAEQQAAVFLQSHGFQILHQNYHSKFGEIDLIAKNAQDLVFVEVKARSKTQYGQSSEVVSITKQQKIIKTALTYLSKYPEMNDLYCRFDVICFDFQQQFAKTVQHDFSQFLYDLNWIENAFTFDPEFINL
ncbi:YraN family protein [Acinetobacter sp. ANC 7201]|uniref:YraN family protein n=1 Tax=Acinetobacter TaxID=469 RepID=UPI0027A9D4C7|nr:MULTISPECIES: YraN family protein [Acinetobacter]MDY6457081.1 YraN family protein [Acinetobacter faecalis]WFP96032.1 YraN family protein [Acinetobacter sp. ANC 7201]